MPRTSSRPPRPSPGAEPEPPEQIAYPVGRDALRVLAHPLRARLLAELRTLGPATASELARNLDTNTGATSYHLRRLAAAGLIAEAAAPETGGGRRRVWEARTEDRALEIDDADDSDAAAAEWLARDYVQHFAGKAQAWITDSPDWSTDWQDAAGLDDRLVLVTDAQLVGLRAEIEAVLARYRRAGAGNPQAKRVAFYTCALPVGSAGRGGQHL